ncbi:MAG: carbohydrate porin [Cyanobacteria bacterium P01_A01_bin.105]
MQGLCWLGASAAMAQTVPTVLPEARPVTADANSEFKFAEPVLPTAASDPMAPLVPAPPAPVMPASVMPVSVIPAPVTPASAATESAATESVTLRAVAPRSVAPGSVTTQSAVPVASAEVKDEADTDPIQRAQANAETLAPLAPAPAIPAVADSPVAATTAGPLLDEGPITPPSLNLQGALVQVGDEFSARARLRGYLYLSSEVLVGATVDLTTGEAFSDTDGTGLSISELYVAAAPSGAPNLRFAVGQLDLTSYFDRNSFAKDSLTHFFNPVFQTNPALAATQLQSQPAALVNWRAADNVILKAATFSSGGIEDFAIDGFVGEVGVRFGDLILRGTYASADDAGARSSFPEIFQSNRGNGIFGTLPGDREVSYGVNAEWFIPSLNLGLFGRYGYQENQALDLSGETYSGGINLLDVFMPDDRLGVGYGWELSNDTLRQQQGGDTPDVFEVFYDVRLAPNIRAAVDFQQRNSFSETYLGVRVRADTELLGQ